MIKKFVSKLYNLFFRSKIVANIMRRMPSPLRSEYIKAKSKLDFALTAGKAFRNRPAAMICTELNEHLNTVLTKKCQKNMAHLAKRDQRFWQNTFRMMLNALML